ncbi:MAG: PEGA domain-containing protein [Gammaproteobacteria bacterium]|nr:PEGA domain-containing protein [Gammaproteobacteria bacterium]
MNAADGNNRIEASTYQPWVAPAETSRLKTWHFIAVAVVVPVLAFVLFLFTARSVALKFSDPPVSVDIDGGFSISLGDVWLLLPGDYTVIAVADGCLPLETQITVTDASNQGHTLQFTPLPGVIDLSTEPEGADVKVDGRDIGTTPLKAVDIDAGNREIVFAHPRYQTFATVFPVQGRRIAEVVQAKLVPNWGDISVSSEPPGAAVLVDGEETGQVTPAVVQIIAGEREVAASLKGYRTARQRIVVGAQQADTLETFVLVQADAGLSVTTSPAGAGITINGEYMGQSPLKLELRSGRAYSVEAYLRGHRRAATTVNLERDQTRAVNLGLTRETGQVVFAAEPASARLSINGREQSSANQTLVLSTEPQNIEITLPGYASYTTRVIPRAGLIQTVKVQLLTVDEARKARNKPVYTAKSGQEMVLFAPTSVQLGASRREPGRRANENLRDIKLSQLFYLAKTETTNAQFVQFASGHDSGEFESQKLNKSDQPVVNVGWTDAALFCNWLSEQENLPKFYREEFGKITGINPAAHGYRLPTEAEWGWVARHLEEGKPQLRFPWGDNMPPPDRHGNYADRAASHLVGRTILQYNDNHVVTAPVGSYKPNHKGIYDLGGNVAEWVNDFYSAGDGVTDPLGPASGEFHVINGSSYMHGTITDLRLAFRDYGIDARRDVGFRIARFAE